MRLNYSFPDLNKFLILALTFLTLLVTSQTGFSQTGTEFWLAPPEATSGHSDDNPIVLRIASGLDPATVTVSMPANPGFTPIVVNMAALSTNTVNLQPYKETLETKPMNAVLNTGLLIEATSEITVYYELNNAQNPEIWALKGPNGLGTEFYVPFQQKWANGPYTPAPYTSFDIVATEDNTTILVYPTRPLFGGHPAYQSFTVTLDRGQTWSGGVISSNGADNPSGTIVTSDKPIAISVKDDSVRGEPQGCRDMNGDQLVPVEIVGTDYIAIRGGLTITESVFITATANNTQVYVDGVLVSTLFNGQTLESPFTGSSTTKLIQTSKPVYVTHMSGFGCETGTALLPPLNCAGSEQIFFTRSTNEYFGLNFLVPSGAENDFELNGNPGLVPGSAFADVPGTDGEWKWAKISFTTAQIPVNSANIITNDSEVFSMGIINGGAGSGCRYGFFSEFSAAIEVNAGPNQIVCANRTVQLDGDVSGGANQGIWTSNGTGSFSPDANAFDAIYEPSLADISSGSVTLTLTSVSNCFEVSDEMTVTFTPGPVVDAGPDLVACGNSPVVQLNGEVLVASGGLWSGGAGTFSPNSGSLTATYTPTPEEIASGSLVLTLTSTGNGNCFPETDEVTINFLPSPIADAGPNQIVCANNPAVVLDGSVTNASGGIWTGGSGNFSPSNTSLGATYTPSAAEISTGIVSLTLTTTGNGGCNAESDFVTITITPAPVVNAGNDMSICRNNAVAQLAGGVTGATGGIWSGGNGTFSPNNTALNAVYTPTAGELAANSLTLTLTSSGNGNCIPVTDQVTLNFTNPPVVNAGVDRQICINNPQILLEGSLTGASIAIWTGGSGTFSPANNVLNAVYTPTPAEISSGSLTLTLTSIDNGNCVAVSDQVEFVFTPTPIVDAGENQSRCANNPNATLSGSVSIAGGGIWSGGEGTFSPSNTALNAVYTPTPAEVASGSVVLTLTSTNNGNCNPVSDNIQITYTLAPTANAGSDAVYCANNSAIQLNGIVSIASGGVWSGGLGTFSPNPNTLNAIYTPTAGELAAGNVTLTLTTTGNGNCNNVSDQVTYTFTPAPTVDAGSNITVCANNPVAQLNAEVTIASGGLWTGGAGIFSPNNASLTATYTPTAAEIANGSVTLTLTTFGNGTCNPVEDQVTITINPAPVVFADENKVVCGNNPVVTLNGTVANAGGGIWSGGTGNYAPSATAMNMTYTPSEAEIEAGFVTLTLTSTSNGLCNAVSDQVTITITDAPTANAGSDVVVCANNAAVTLNGNVTIASGGVWSGGLGTFTPNASTLNAVYTPTATEIANNSVTLTLTTTGNGTCIPVTDQMTISFTPAPVVDAGSNITACANAAQVQLDGDVTVASGGTWTGGAGIFTPNANALNAFYTPTPGEIAAGSVTLTLTSTGNDDCNAVSDQVTITYTPAPTADAGEDITVCENNPAVALDGNVTIATGGIWSGGAGSFNPSPNALEAVYTPTASEIASGSIILTLTTTGNGLCNEVSDQILITFSEAPTVNAGPDQEVCSNNAEIQLNGSVTVTGVGTWSGGNGTFVPSANALNAVYIPTQAEINSGSITLELESRMNGNCFAVSDEVTITFSPSPTANAGANQVLCSNNALIQLNGEVTIATGGTWSGGNGTFAPNANDLNAVYTPTPTEIASGSLTLTLTTTGNDDCNPVSDNVTISFTPSPTANAGSNKSVCENNPEVSISGSVSIATGGVWSGGEGTYDPSPNALSITYTPTAAEIANGSVTLTLTTTGNGDCNPVSDNMVITFTEAPTANAGNDVVVCSNNAAVQLNGEVTIATGGTWSGGSGTFSPNATTLNAVYTPSQSEINSGSVTLTLTTTGNGGCSPVSDEITIDFTPSPTADAGSNITVCSNNAAVQLDGEVTIASGGTWSGGNGTFNPGANALNAVYTPTAAEIASGSLTLTLTTTGNGDCIAVTDDVLITFSPTPTVNAGSDFEVCENNPQISLSGSVTIATGGIWSGGDGTFNPSPNALNVTYTPTPEEIENGSITFTLTSTGNGDCIAVTDQITVTFTPSPTADAGDDIVLCSNNPVAQLDGAVTIATGGIWSGGNGTFSPNSSALNAVYTPTEGEINNGSVTLTLTTTGNGDCIAVTDQVTLSFTPSPTADAGSNIVVCANNADVQLDGEVTIATGGIWSGGNGTFSPNANALNAVYTPTAAEIANGSLTLTLTTTGNGDCIAVTDQVSINFTPAPTANAGADYAVCENNALITLSGFVSVATGGIWSGGDGTFNPSATALNATYTPTPEEIESGSLTLTLTTTGNGDCIAVSDMITVTFTPSPTADAGEDQILCSNNAVAQLDGAVTIATGGTWSGGNGTFSPNASALNAVYTPTEGEINNGSVTLTLTTTGNGGCLPEMDQVTLSFTPSPTVDAGNNQTLCANNAQITLNGEVTIATGGIWTGGAGTFNPSATDLNAVYTPTATEIANGSVTLTLTTTGNGDCIAVSDQITINFTPAPIANAGTDKIVCSNNAVVSLNGFVSIATGGIWSGGDGEFEPSNTSLNALYTPTAAEIAAGTLTLTLTTTGNGDCLAESDQVLITFTPTPVVNAGNDEVLCRNNPEIQLNGSVTVASGGIWSGGNGTFTPNASALDATYLPSEGELNAGIVTLTLTSTGNGNCVPESDQVTYTFTPSPVANAGNNQTYCANNAVIQLDGSVSVATGGIWSGGAGVFNPGPTALNGTYTPTAEEIQNGSVTLTLTTTGNGDCNPVSDEVTINFTPAPQANAGSDKSVCSNNAAVTLNGSVTVASGGIWSGGDGVFDPSNTAVNAIYTPTAAEIAAGSLILTLTTTGNGDCNPVSDQMEITFTPTPVVNAGSNQTLCANNAEVQLNGSVTIAEGGVWSGGLGTFTPNNTTLNALYTPTPGEIFSGSVTLVLTSTGNGGCIPVTDEVTITFTPAPTVDAGSNVTVCASDPSVSLEGEITIATGGEWSGGSGTFSPNSVAMDAVYTPSAAEIAAGTVTLTLTSTGNGNCIPVSDEIVITIEPEPIVSAGPNLSSCANNSSVELQGSFSNATGIIWSGGTGSFSPGNTSPNSTYIPSPAEIAAGVVTLTITTTGNGTCEPAVDQTTITISPSPVANAGSDLQVCENNPNVQLNGIVEFAAGGVWSGGTGTFGPGPNTLNANYQPSAADIANGFVVLTLTTTGNGNCNAVSDNMTITFTPGPVTDAGPDQTICANNPEVQLNGSFTVAEGAMWTGGTGTFFPGNTSTNATYTPTATELSNGSVTLTLTTFGNQNCLPSSDQVTITFTPPPTVDAGEDFFACVDDLFVPLEGSIEGTTNTGTWSTSGTGIFVPNNTVLNGTYIASSADSLIGSVTLTLTSTNNGNCVAVTDQMQVFILPAGNSNAGPDQTICANNSTVHLTGTISGAASSGVWTTSGTGVFLPSPNVMNPDYVPGDEDLEAGSVVLTFAANSCNQAEDQMTVTFTPAPEVYAGEDRTTCSSDLEIELNGFVSGGSSTGTWTTTGTGSFVPSPNALNAVYMASPEDVEVQILTFTLTSTNNGNCIAVTDQFTLNIFPSGTANAGPNQTVCENNPAVQLAGSITGGATEGVWSTSGTGTFEPDANDLNAIYHPSPADLLNGTVNLVLSAVNSCNSANDIMVVNITPSPVVNAGEDMEACEVIPDFNLSGSVENAGGAIWTTQGDGVFGNANDLNTTYTPGTTDVNSGGVWITLTSADNGNCLAVSDSLFITLSTGVIVNAGEDQFVCSLADFTQLQGQVSNGSTTGLWTTTGTGTFIPGPEALNALYQMSEGDIENGSVSFTLTSTNNGACPEQSDEMTITFGDQVFVDAGQDQVVCADVTEVPLNGLVTAGATAGTWTTTGTGSFSPSADDLNATYIPGAEDLENGNVTLTLTSTDQEVCAGSSDNMTITFQPEATVNAGEDILVCDASGTVQLLGQSTGAEGIIWSTAGTGVFQPNNTTPTAIYVPSTADSLLGSVTLTLTTVSNGICPSVSDEMTISFGTLLEANAGNDFEICASETELQLNGSVTGTETGVWTTTGSGSFVPDNNTLNAEYIISEGDITAGEIFLILTTTNNGGCPAASDSLMVTIHGIPTADAGEDMEVCADGSVVPLNGVVENSPGFNWVTSGSGTFDPSSDVLSTTYIPSNADLASGSVTITLNADVNGLCPGTNDQIVITFREEAVANAGTDQTLCEIVESVQLNGLVTGGSTTGEWSSLGNGTFVPDNQTLNAEYIPGTNDLLLGSVQLILTSTENGSCNAATDTLTVTFDPAPEVQAGDDIITCQNSGSVVLNGAFNNAEGIIWTSLGGGSFEPSNDVTNPTYIFSDADIANGGTTIIITTTGNLSCPAASDTLELSLENPLLAGFTAGPACVGNAVSFTDTTVVLSGDIASWTWNLGNGSISNEQNPTTLYLSSGTYTISLVVESSSGCTDSISQTIIVSENPVADFTVNPETGFIGDEISFTDNSIDAVAWLWDFDEEDAQSNEQNPVYAFTSGGEHVVWLTVTNDNGCVDSTSTRVFIDEEKVLPPKVPNSFSPNGDGMNDIFFVRGGPFTEINFTVYDAWGNKLFTSTDQSIGWDGTHKNKIMPVGLYVYTVDAITIDGRPFTFTGNITLLR